MTARHILGLSAVHTIPIRDTVPAAQSPVHSQLIPLSPTTSLAI